MVTFRMTLLEYVLLITRSFTLHVHVHVYVCTYIIIIVIIQCTVHTVHTVS